MADRRPPLYQETETRVQRVLHTRRSRRFLWVALVVLAPLLALLLGRGFAIPNGRTSDVTPTSLPVVAGEGPGAPPIPLTRTASAIRATGSTPETGAVSPSRTSVQPVAAPLIVATSGPTRTAVVTATTGLRFIVAGTNGEGVVLRRAPAGERIDVYREGIRLEELGPDREMDGVVWRHVRASDGVEGWVAAQYTAPVP